MGLIRTLDCSIAWMNRAINGVSVGSSSNMIFAPWRIGETAQNWIGRSQWSGDPYFAGSIDDFRIYRGAMTADQVAALVQAA